MDLSILLCLTGVIHEADYAYSIQILNSNLVLLLAGPISHTSIQYMDHIEMFQISLDLSDIYLLVLVGVELPFCVVVTPS